MKAKENQQEKGSGLAQKRYSISAKLITITTIIVLLSLGSITALVSWLVRQDLRIAAEENNFEVNRRSAMIADYTFETIRSNSILLIQAVNSLGAQSDAARQTVDFFFEQNQLAAAVAFAPAGREMVLFINRQYFASWGMDPALANNYFENQRGTLRRAAMGETVLLNAAPFFNASLLGMFFNWQNSGGGILFSPENLTDSFGFGANQSYLINDTGDILVHADDTMLKNAVNVSENNFTRFVWDNPAKNLQTLYTDEEGLRYFGAFTKLNTGGCTVITSIEFNRVFDQVTATTRRNIYLTAGVLSLSILIIWFFSKSISNPIKALAGAARTIEGGNFDITLKSRGRDEIGILTESFQRMCKALSIFGRFTNRDIAVRAMRGEIKPGGLTKHATIFFSDIRGFTIKSENFTKEFGEEASDRIVYWLNDYLTQMIECIEKTGGVVDKFIGDAVMAHWGTAYTAGSPAKDACNCVTAALMMRKALFNMNKNRKLEDHSNPPIRIGCGVNTGIVTAGQIGSNLRMEYTVIGDPVNLASRTESLTKTLGTDILITEDTWKLVKDSFITEELPQVKIRGREKPVKIFAVINVIKTDKGPKTLADVRKLLGIEAPETKRIKNE
ncbi:MAG: adenylate/guanylate cyclase domain-containing protein [Treponema sp.]|nr:adenylate/guanylate cyclase domain-containing protein [Treponema sp.]